MQGVSEGMWLQFVGVDGMQNGLFGKAIMDFAEKPFWGVFA